VRRPLPADFGLLLLTGAVVAAAVRVVTHDPGLPVSLAAVVPSPNASRAPTPTPSGTPVSKPHGRLLLVGSDLAPLAASLGDLGWSVDTAVSGAEVVVSHEGLAALAEPPALVVLEIPAGTRTTDRASSAVAVVRGAFPHAVIALVGPFDRKATRTTSAVAAVATDQGVRFVDPVAQGWTDGLTPDQIAERLSLSFSAALTPA
jgi:hypothetical protein